MDPFIGEIRLVGFTFAPQGWAFCNGQLLPIAQNTALFSLLGTTYGGDGRTTFGLPDLRGRAAVGFGQGNRLQNYQQGETWSVNGGADPRSGSVNMLGMNYIIALQGIFPSRD